MKLYGKVGLEVQCATSDDYWTPTWIAPLLRAHDPVYFCTQPSRNPFRTERYALQTARYRFVVEIGRRSRSYEPQQALATSIAGIELAALIEDERGQLRPGMIPEGIAFAQLREERVVDPIFDAVVGGAAKSNLSNVAKVAQDCALVCIEVQK